MPIVVTQNSSLSNETPNASLRSEETHDFISRRPGAFFRWGTVVFLLILVSMGFVCWFIKYPDVIVSSARLTSVNAPKAVFTRTEGRIEQLFVKNGDFVEKGQLLAFIEGPAIHSSVAIVKSVLDSIKWYVVRDSFDKVVTLSPNYIHQQYLKDLGELQQPFETFMHSFTSFRNYISKGFFVRKIAMLRVDLSNADRQANILSEQKQLLQQDLNLARATLEANKSLAAEKVISVAEYRTEQSKVIGKELSLPQVNSAIVSNESQQNEKLKEIADLENQIFIQKSNFIQTLQSLISLFEQWDIKYVIRAPISGKVELAGFFEEYQFIKSGQLLFYLQPGNTEIFAEMLIPQYNFGKVAVGQDVLLKFHAFPHEQFGVVTGRIDFISSTPTDSGYLAKVAIEQGLETSFGKHLQFKHGLLADADVITENVRLLQRIYFGIVKNFSR